MKDVTIEFRQEIQKDENIRLSNIQRYYFHEYMTIEEIKRQIKEQKYWRTMYRNGVHYHQGNIKLVGLCACTTQSLRHKTKKYSILDYRGERIMAHPKTKEVETLLRAESKLARIVFIETYTLLPSGILVPKQKRIRNLPIVHAVPEKGGNREIKGISTVPDTMPEEWIKIATLEEALV